MKGSKKQRAPPGKQVSGTGKQSAAKQGNTGPPGNGVASKIWDDERFAHLIDDPRYRGIPNSKKKVKIDTRFKAMFEDGRFNERATSDKYGRKLRQTQSDEMKKFYELEESDNEEEAQRERELEERAMEGRMAKSTEETSDSDSEPDSDDGLQLNEEEKKMSMPPKIKQRLRDPNIDYARGDGVLLSESSSSEDSDDGEGADDDDEVFIEHVWGELDADAERTEDSTKRLAVCHMDWDRIRAVDIMILLNSFLPPGSSIKSVTIYPSEFGKERMKEEEERGPQELTTHAMEDSDEDVGDDEETQKERLREYQLNRLKYYYAVVECDTAETADKIYKECDGVEYESTANKIDLRFIPDEMEFDDKPKDHCNELPDMSKYVPRIFSTSALKQAKVELTWDENDPDRNEFNDKIRDGKWAQMPESELKKYVVCSSSDEENENGDSQKPKRSVVLVRSPEASGESEGSEGSDSDAERNGNRKEDMIAKYKALLNDVKEQTRRDDKIGMEFTWKVDGDGKENAVDSEQEDEEDEDERSGGRRGYLKTLPDDVNPFEKILQKKKEKSKRRKELKKRRKRGELDGSEGEASGDDSSDDDTPYGVDLNDPFFASAFDADEFDVGGKQKSKTKDRKAAKQQLQEREEQEAADEARRKAELELLLDDGEDNKAHFNLRAIQEGEVDLKTVSKSKRRRILKKSKQQIEEKRNAKAATDDFEVNVEDSRFGAIFSKADYNIDPTNPAFKKTKAMERLIQHKLQKRQLAENDVRERDTPEQSAKKAKKDVATTMLVKSIKRKIGKAT